MGKYELLEFLFSTVEQLFEICWKQAKILAELGAVNEAERLDEIERGYTRSAQSLSGGGEEV